MVTGANKVVAQSEHSTVVFKCEYNYGCTSCLSCGKYFNCCIYFLMSSGYLHSMDITSYCTVCAVLANQTDHFISFHS